MLDLGTGVPTPAQLKASGTSSVPLSLPPLAALYNPGSGRWVPASPLHSARLFYTATLLTAGQVLVAGGAGAHTTLGSADLYTPAAVQP